VTELVSVENLVKKTRKQMISTKTDAKE